MAKEILQTHAICIPGQSLPVPAPPPGDGWQLIAQQQANDERGQPILRWTWQRELSDEGEYLVQA
jgi:hypothetical protein